MLAQLADRRPFERARAYAYDYLDGVLSQPAFPGPDAIRGLDAFDEPLPAAPTSPETMLHMLHQYGSPATVANAGGRYFGFVTGGALPAAVAARWLLDVWDQNPALYLLSPVSARLETVCERWLVELLGLPAGTAAGYVVGTSAATLCGLVAGRNHLL